MATPTVTTAARAIGRGAAADVPAWERRVLPPAARAPSMLTEAELNYLYWLTADAYRGRGRVVELGCYLGGSTAALVEGMTLNPRARTPLLTYDAFVMDEWSNRFLPTPYRPGESFRPLFEIHLRDRLHRIDVREGWIPTEMTPDVERALYPEQEPIEILFIDAAKRPDVHHAILRCFGRHLVPGHAIVVQQDFKDAVAFWLPLDMTALGPCFEPLDSIPWSATLAFRYLGGLEERLDALVDPAVSDPARIESSWDEVDRHLTDVPCPELPALLRLQRASHLFQRGRLDAFGAELERFVATFDPRGPGQAAMAVVSQWHRFLETKRWQVAMWSEDAAGVDDTLARLQRRSLDGEIRVPPGADAAAGDKFGVSVSVSGDTVIVGGPW